MKKTIQAPKKLGLSAIATLCLLNLHAQAFASLNPQTPKSATQPNSIRPVVDDLSEPMHHFFVNRIATHSKKPMVDQNNENLETLLSSLGVPYEVSEDPYLWSEDNKIVARQGQQLYLYQPLPQYGLQEIPLEFAKAIKQVNSSQYAGFHNIEDNQQELMFQQFSAKGLDANSIEKFAAQIQAQATNLDSVQVKSIVPIINGGNHLAGRKQDGSYYVLVGQDSLYHTIFNYFGYDLRKRPNIADQFDQDVGFYFDQAIFNQGLRIKMAAHRAFLTKIRTQQPLSKYDEAYKAKYLFHRALLKALNPQKPNSRNSFNLVKATLSYFVYEDLTRVLMAKTFGVADLQSLIVVPQASFHIDMTMRPVHQGEVWVDSPAVTYQLLEQTYSYGGCRNNGQYKNKKQAKFCQTKQATLAHAQAQLPQRQKVYEQIESVLTEQGLMVHPVPGSMKFYQEEKGQVSAISGANFMNGFINSQANGGFSYAVLGSRYPIINKSYRDWIENDRSLEVGENFDLHLFGTQPLSSDNATNQVLADEYFFAQGGLDCITIHF
jgi:hypothetical protein